MARKSAPPAPAPAPAVPALINVDYVRPEVETAAKQWATVRDCIDGQEAIKKKGTDYLPMPNAGDLSTENKLRYASYSTRGLFINMTARTLNGMVGTAFSKAPVATLPAALDVIHENVDGGSVTLDQQAKQVLSDVLSVGRCGLLPDYPTTDGAFVSREQINNGEVRPVIQYYFAEDIINWNYTTVNSLRKLSLVVLREKFDTSTDEFKRDYGDQYRVLRLENRQYTAEVIRKTASGFVSMGKVMPLQSGGKPFDTIPFEFVGARNNDGGIDEVPLIGLANINVAHFRNSCDFEEMVFIVGQPTTVISGLSKSWVDEVLNGKVVIGSTTSLLLPDGADAKYLEVSESQIALKAMEHKEAQATSIGAKLINPATVQRTAKEATMDDASEQSVLLSAVYNVNAAYKRAIAACALFAGAPVTEDMGYELNTDFEIMSLDATALAARVKMWTDGAITFTEVRSILTRAGIATLTDEEATAELKKEAADNLAAMGMSPDGEPVDANGNVVPTPAEGEE